MNVHELVTTTRDALDARTVFGEPIERDGVTVIPAAVLRGGVGGGGGQDEQGQRGEGGGFGLTARPAGAYVIKGGVVRWQPAFDLNRTIGLVAGVAPSRTGDVRGRCSAAPTRPSVSGWTTRA
jgi:uncharacterized spore protein YtfJ